MNEVAEFINDDRVKASPQVVAAAPGSVAQSYHAPTARDTEKEINAFDYWAPAPNVIQSAKVIDGKHAVLVVREAPDSSSQVASEYVKQAENNVPRSPLGRIVFVSDDFILATISETEEERVTPSYNMRGAVVSTSAEDGLRPRIFAYAGTLLRNAIDGSSFANMMSAWDKYLRVTACVIDTVGSYRSRRIPLVVELHYRDQVRRGYPINIRYSQNSSTDASVSFSFSMFIVESYAKERASTGMRDDVPDSTPANTGVVQFRTAYRGPANNAPKGRPEVTRSSSDRWRV